MISNPQEFPGLTVKSIQGESYKLSYFINPILLTDIILLPDPILYTMSFRTLPPPSLSISHLSHPLTLQCLPLSSHNPPLSSDCRPSHLPPISPDPPPSSFSLSPALLPSPSFPPALLPIYSMKINIAEHHREKLILCNFSGFKMKGLDKVKERVSKTELDH